MFPFGRWQKETRKATDDKKNKYTGDQSVRAQLVAEHSGVKLSWDKYGRRWMRLYYLLSTAAVCLTTVGASAIITDLDQNSRTRELVLVSAAILTALIALYKPSEKADRYRLAWATLGNAIDRFIYQPDETDGLLDGVRTACLWGESVVRNNAPLSLDKEWAEGARQRDLEKTEQALLEAAKAEAEAKAKKQAAEESLKSNEGSMEAAIQREKNASDPETKADAKAEQTRLKEEAKNLSAEKRKAELDEGIAQREKDSLQARLDRLKGK